VVTYISAFLVLNGQFIMFSTDIFYVLNGVYQKLARLPLLLANWDLGQFEESCQL
jgi:hypothetical protein